jgi:hypothetical protein
MLRRVPLVTTDTAFIRIMLRLLVTANVVPGSPILITLMMEAYVPPKRRFLQEPRGVSSKKTTFLKGNVRDFKE